LHKFHLLLASAHFLLSTSRNTAKAGLREVAGYYTVPLGEGKKYYKIEGYENTKI
jgi:hypothetical protein